MLYFWLKGKPDTITLGELNKGDFETIGTVGKDFFGNNPIFSIAEVKYKNCIDAVEKIDCYKSLEEQNISLVKAGVNVYEVGKGNPKMTKEDVDNHIYEADSMIDDSYKPYYLGKDVNRYYLSWNKEKTRQLIKKALRKASHSSRTVLLKGYFSDIPCAEEVVDEHNTLPYSW